MVKDESQIQATTEGEGTTPPAEGTKKKDETPPAEGGAATTGKNSVENGSEIDRAIGVNKERKEILEREEKLMKRKEDLAAIQMVGGTTQAGQGNAGEKEETNSEYRQRIQKEMAAGKTEFGN